LCSRFADPEVAGVVDGGLGAKGDSFFVILLDPAGLELDVQRRDDAIGEDPGAEAARCGPLAAPDDPPVEDGGHAVGSTEVDVVADDLFEEDPHSNGTVEDLGERELGLKDRDVVAIPRSAFRDGERMRKAGRPLAHEAVDLLVVEAVADPLQPRWCSDEAKPLSRGSKRIRRSRLAFGPLVAVQADLGISGASSDGCRVTHPTRRARSVRGREIGAAGPRGTRRSAR
jgi:hypothetical protein